MPWLEKMALRQISSANYITSINGMVHPDRVLPEHDFLYMLDGDWEIYEDGCAYQMHSDDLIILSANHHHYGKKLCNPGNRHMYFHVFPTESESDPKINMEEMEPANAFFCPVLVHCQNHPRIKYYMQEIISVYWSMNSEKKYQLTLLYNLLLCELAELLTYTKSDVFPDTMVEEVCQLIQANPQVFYTAKEIAASHFICPRTLNNRFMKVCHKTFTAYQMSIKLEMVRQFLLHQPDAKLREAALNFGFYDEFHLSRTFKKHFGLSPSALLGKIPAFPQTGGSHPSSS